MTIRAVTAKTSKHPRDLKDRSALALSKASYLGARQHVTYHSPSILSLLQRTSCGASSLGAERRARDTDSPDVSRSPASAARYTLKLFMRSAVVLAALLIAADSSCLICSSLEHPAPAPAPASRAAENASTVAAGGALTPRSEKAVHRISKEFDVLCSHFKTTSESPSFTYQASIWLAARSALHSCLPQQSSLCQGQTA